jgi:hypothetical protein
MRTAAAAVVAALALTAAGCGASEPSLAAWCGLVADGAVVPVGAADAPELWLQLEASAPADVRADVERLRVAAQQVAQLDPGDVTAASRLVLTPLVLDAHGRIVDAIRSRCRIDVSTLTVIEQR